MCIYSALQFKRRREKIQIQLVIGEIYEGRSSTEVEPFEVGIISHNILAPFISSDLSSTSTFRFSPSAALFLSSAQDIASIIVRGIQGMK